MSEELQQKLRDQLWEVAKRFRGAGRTFKVQRRSLSFEAFYKRRCLRDH